MEQLFKKETNDYEKIYPFNFIQNLNDITSDKSLPQILSTFNNIFLPYQDNAENTRNLIPILLRRKGLWITYNNGDKYLTEYYKGDASDIQLNWGKDYNWGIVPDVKYVQTEASKLPNGIITPDKLSPALQELIKQNNNITNLPDDEDLEERNGVISFKDRVYNPYLSTGKGYKILRMNWVNGKNILTQNMINEENTIYEIRYDFDLNEETITVPEKCILKFVGGSLSNGKLIGTNTIIEASPVMIFSSIITEGDFISPCYVEWFGAITYYKKQTSPKFSTDAIQKAFDSAFTEIRFCAGIYYVDETLTLTSAKNIKMRGNVNPVSLKSTYDLLYNRQYVDCTIISTLSDINVLNVAISAYRESDYDNTLCFSIAGGVFDVSNVSSYNSAVIRCAATDKTMIWNHKIATNIFGPLVNINSYEGFSPDSHGIGLQYTNDSDGSFYVANIDCYISGFTYGIKNDISNLNNITSFTIGGTISRCATHIDVGNGIKNSVISSTIQPGKFFTDNTDTHCIKGILLSTCIDAIFWDLNLSSKRGEITVYSNKYAFFVDNRAIGICITNRSQMTLAAPNLIDGAVYLLSRQFNNNTIITRSIRTYGKNQKAYFGLIDNVWFGYDSIEITHTGNITDEELLGNPFTENGLILRPKNVDRAGSNVTVTITNFIAQNIYPIKFLVTENLYVPTLSTFKTIVITAYNGDSVVKSMTFNNIFQETQYAQDFVAIWENSEYIQKVDKIVVELKDLYVAESLTDALIRFEGNSTYNVYRHICLPTYTNIKGKFILHGHTFRVEQLYNGTPYLFDQTGNVFYFGTGGSPRFYSVDEIANTIAESSAANRYGNGARFNLVLDGRLHQVFYDKQTSTVMDAFGRKAGLIRGTTAQRPTELEYGDRGYEYFDQTLNKPIWWNGTKWIDSTGATV